MEHRVVHKTLRLKKKITRILDQTEFVDITFSKAHSAIIIFLKKK